MVAVLVLVLAVVVVVVGEGVVVIGGVLALMDVHVVVNNGAGRRDVQQQWGRGRLRV